MPTLDYSTPLHTFTSGNLSYTAVSDCYLFGYGESHSGGGITVAVINNTVNVCTMQMVSNSGHYMPIDVCVKLSSGDTVTTDTVSPNLHILAIK